LWEAGQIPGPHQQAYPFLMMMASGVRLFLLWRRRCQQKLHELAKAQEWTRANPQMGTVRQGQQTRVLYRKTTLQKFFAKNVLPEVGCAATAIKTNTVDSWIPEESFVSY
jgi:hypothetical protein